MVDLEIGFKKGFSLFLGQELGEAIEKANSSVYGLGSGDLGLPVCLICGRYPLKYVSVTKHSQSLHPLARDNSQAPPDRVRGPLRWP